MTKAEVNKRKFIFDGAINLFYAPEVKSEAKEKIEIVKEYLQENPEMNFVLYFNHISLDDPAALLRVANLIDPNGTRHLVVPSSLSHANSNDFLGKFISFSMEVVAGCGIEVMPVVQTFQVGEKYTQEEARESYIKLFNRLKELKKSEIPTGVIIGPEGHRSENGELSSAESGMVAAGRLLSPVMYIPLAISYGGEFKRDKMNIGSKMKINIGEITVQETAREYPSIEELMMKLAGALPEEMRGVWK